MSNMIPLTLQGTLQKDGMTITLECDIPPELEGLFNDGNISNPVFEEFEPGDTIKFDVWISGPTGRKRMTFNKDSVHKVDNLSYKNGFEGWENIEGVWFAPEEIRLLDLISPTLERGEAFNIEITGPSGYGKTARSEAWAKHRNMTHVEINCGVLRNPLDFFGHRGFDGDKTTFEETSAAGIMQQGNAVILLDEINRTNSIFKNGFMSILDYRRRAEILGKEIKVGPSVLFMATVNSGDRYTGNFEADAAQKNRFAAGFSVGPPPTTVEVEIILDHFDIGRANAEKITLILHQLRKDDIVVDAELDITTRPAINIAELMYNNATIQEAFAFVIANRVRATNYDLYKNILDRVGEYE